MGLEQINAQEAADEESVQRSFEDEQDFIKLCLSNVQLIPISQIASLPCLTDD